MGFLSEVFGSKPSVPKLPPVDIEAEQRAAIAQNIAALPGAEDLASQVNQFNEQELAKQLGLSLNEYKAMQRMAGQGIGAELRGELPADVLDSIQRYGAQRGLFSGVAGSPAAGAWTARDLGLSSLDVFHKGLTAAERWLAWNRAGMFDVTSMFFTPQQRLAFTTSERNMQFARNWLASQVAAMPDPVTRGIFDFTNNMIASAANYWGGNMQTTPTGQLGRTQTPQTPQSLGGGGVGQQMESNDFYGTMDQSAYGMDYGGEFDTVQSGMNFSGGMGAAGGFAGGAGAASGAGGGIGAAGIAGGF